MTLLTLRLLLVVTKKRALQGVIVVIPLFPSSAMHTLLHMLLWPLLAPSVPHKFFIAPSKLRSYDVPAGSVHLAAVVEVAHAAAVV